MQNKRRDISYIEDIIEEAFGVCDDKHIEMVKLLFNYVTEEIKVDTESFGYRFPSLGVLYLDYHLYKAKESEQKTEEEKLIFLNRVGAISEFADSLGGLSKNKAFPHVFKMERSLRKKFDLPKTSLLSAGRIPPTFLAAIERLQNNNFEKNKKENE